MKSEELWGFVPGWAKLGFICLTFCAAVVGFAAESISITATPRYPWNGKVDLKFTIDGTSGTKYDTSFTAKDVAGGTNLTMKTLTKSDGTAANVAKEQLSPGTYNWVWDATADLGEGTVLEKVVVEGKTEKTLDINNATYLVIDLSGGSSAKSYPVSYLDAVPSGGWSDTYKTTKLVLRKCNAGIFSMQNNRSVKLSKDFYVGVFEVTQKQYKLITGQNPPENDGDCRPVANVNYDQIHGGTPKTMDGASVLGVLKSKTSLDVDLPTEAQWEYACRAGTSTDEPIDAYGRYSGNGTDGKGGFVGKTTVGSYLPNKWGIYDMRGNVWEWCRDGWQSDLGTAAVTDPLASPDNAYYPVLRGGGNNHGASYCTSYYRMYGIHNLGSYVPFGGNCGHGFRVCVTVK